MILVLGNFAGVFSNINKLLNWSIILKDEDKILFYYANKFGCNQDPIAPPFRNYIEDISRIFFYKYFQYPEDCNESSFLQANRFEMGYPTIAQEELPQFLHDYKDSFIYTNPKVYFDSNFPEIRTFYASHLAKRLHFTPYMRTFFEKELSFIQSLQSEGKKVLAIMLRTTIHYTEGGYRKEEIFDEINEIQKNYDYILPITQIQAFYDVITEFFKEKCIPLERERMPGDMDWNSNTSDEGFENEFRMCIADVYLASQCDFILSGASNMFMGALFFNPTIPFKIFKELETKVTG
jgi:hypothetical protein